MMVRENVDGLVIHSVHVSFPRLVFLFVESFNTEIVPCPS